LCEKKAGKAEKSARTHTRQHVPAQFVTSTFMTYRIAHGHVTPALRRRVDVLVSARLLTHAKDYSVVQVDFFGGITTIVVEERQLLYCLEIGRKGVFVHDCLSNVLGIG